MASIESYRDIPDLRAREEEIAADLLTSANASLACETLLGIPQDVKDMTIIDLGGGASPLTATLAERGANAFAVDRLYGDTSALLDNLERSFGILVYQQTPPHLQGLMHVQMLESIQKFRNSYQSEPHRYIGGSFTHLPIQDNVADLTVSSHAVGDMARDPEVLEQSVQEALRITKPGGRVVIAPFHTKKGRSTRHRNQHKSIADKLRKMNVGQVTIEKDSDPRILDPRLEIRKS